MKKAKVKPAAKVTEKDKETNSDQSSIDEKEIACAANATMVNPRLYITFKKCFQASGLDPKTLHPDIVSVRMPRRGALSKFCLLVFNSPEKAMKAATTLRSRGDCFVRPASTSAPHARIKSKGKRDVTKQVLLEHWA